MITVSIQRCYQQRYVKVVLGRLQDLVVSIRRSGDIDAEQAVWGSDNDDVL